MERSLSWLMRACRNSRDYERLPEHAEAHITWADTTLMTRRLTRARKQQATLPTILAVCAASMIYLGYHWTTDAVAGFALGGLLRIGIAPLLATALDSRRGAPALDSATAVNRGESR